MWPTRSQVADRLALAIAAGLVMAGALSLAGWFSRWWLPAELACHFRVQYALAGITVGLVLAAIRRFGWALLAAVVAAANLATIAPLYWSPSRAALHEEAHLRVISLNVHSPNRRHDLVVELLHDYRPDFVLLLEVTPGWHDLFDKIRTDYPFQRVEPRSDNFGIALVSRLEFDDAKVVDVGGAEVPSIVAHYTTSAGRLTVIGTHPLPPGSRETWRLRNQQLAVIGRLAKDQPGALVVLGDLNVSSWSAAFDLLTEGTRLRDSRAGFGVQASWPAKPLWLGPARIPIDHCLVSPELEIIDRFVGPAVGSDHYPIVIDLGFRQADGRDISADERSPAPHSGAR